MTVREFLQLIIDADVETGAQTPILIVDEEGKMYSVKSVEVDPTSYDDGGNATSTGPTVFLKAEEM